MRFRGWLKGRRATSLTSYAVVVGLIAVIALLSVQLVGRNVATLFGSVGNRLTNAQPTGNNEAGGGGGQAAAPIASCKGHYAAGSTSSGSYSIDPDGAAGNPAYSTYCEMTLSGGGWTLCAWYNGASPGVLNSLNGADWGADPASRSATGMKGCEALRAASATQEVLVATSAGAAIRYAGVPGAWNSFTAHEFIGWPGATTGTPVFYPLGTGEHRYGLTDPDYALTNLCGNYSPANYEISINKIYTPTSGSCTPPQTASGIVEFGVHDRENCGSCTCNWSSCWSGKTSPNVGVYVR